MLTDFDKTSLSTLLDFINLWNDPIAFIHTMCIDEQNIICGAINISNQRAVQPHYNEFCYNKVPEADITR